MSRLGELKLKVLSYVVPRFLAYEATDFRQVLSRIGIRKGDALMVHASLGANNGFQGKPLDMVRALKEQVGEEGLLVMPSMPYTGSSKLFLMRGKSLDLRRTPSQMGLLSEVFRRGKDTLRSKSSTHPLLAWGSKAQWFISGHEKQISPFSQSGPFGKLLELRGKILCIDAGFESITFTHFVEDRIKDKLPFSLYEKEMMDGEVVDNDGIKRHFSVQVLSDEARRSRREGRLIATLKHEGLLRRCRLGNTRLLLVECQPFVLCVENMYQRGESFFDQHN